MCDNSREITIEQAYTLPHKGEWRFAFVRLDAVYLWTQGGYQVSRNPDDYPLFIAVDQHDVDLWKEFFGRLGIPASTTRKPAEEIDTSIQFVLEPREELKIETVAGQPIVPLEETVEYIHKNNAAFAPALDMIERMYGELPTQE